MMTTSSKGKKPTPQQRAIEKKRARLRKSRAVGHRSHRDPDTYDWEKEGQHFDGLSDDEWALVWKRVRAASPDKSLDEAQLRQMVDRAALSSGWFVEHGGEINLYSVYRRFADENQRFVEKVQTFRRELSDFLCEPRDDDYDPYRKLVPTLEHLAAQLQHDIAEDERIASTLENPPNAAQPKLDAWRGRLVTIWERECGLPLENTKHLRGFLIEALQPYIRPAQLTDRMVGYFIKRWLAGKVPKPPPWL
jgi:hypothetical protein